jgi:hypothetical protein
MSPVSPMSPNHTWPVQTRGHSGDIESRASPRRAERLKQRRARPNVPAQGDRSRLVLETDRACQQNPAEPHARLPSRRSSGQRAGAMAGEICSARIASSDSAASASCGVRRYRYLLGRPILVASMLSRSLLIQPARVSEDGIELPTWRSGQLHEFIAVTRLRNIRNEFSQHSRYRDRNPHIVHV